MNLPNPQQLEGDALTADNIDSFKRYDCTRYERCISTAARRGWTQFHCNACAAYEPLPVDHPARRLFTVGRRKEP